MDIFSGFTKNLEVVKIDKNDNLVIKSDKFFELIMRLIVIVVFVTIGFIFLFAKYGSDPNKLIKYTFIAMGLLVAMGPMLLNDEPLTLNNIDTITNLVTPQPRMEFIGLYPSNKFDPFDVLLKNLNDKPKKKATINSPEITSPMYARLKNNFQLLEDH